MNHLDPASVGGAVERMEKSREGGMAHLAQRLAEDAVLLGDVTEEQARDVLGVLCSFETFDALYTSRGKSSTRQFTSSHGRPSRSLCRAAA